MSSRTRRVRGRPSSPYDVDLIDPESSVHGERRGRPQFAGDQEGEPRRYSSRLRTPVGEISYEGDSVGTLIMAAFFGWASWKSSKKK